MRKLLTLAGMLMVVSGAAAAQGGGGGGGMGMQMTPEQRDSVQLARLFTGITLSADAQAKAKEIIKAAREAMAGTERGSPDYVTKAQEVNNKRNADLKALLSSDDEKAKFDSNAAAAGRRGRRGGGL